MTATRPPEQQSAPLDTTIFFVYKQGYFGHGVHGCSTDQEHASQLATDIANRDLDAHHSYDVYAVPLDKSIPMGDDPMMDYGWMNTTPIFSARKAIDAPAFQAPVQEHDDPLLNNPYQIQPGTPVVFVVYKQGMFGHGLHGASASAEGARAMANIAALQDVDDYHSYDVYAIPIGVAVPLSATPMCDYGWMNVDPVYTINKEVNL